VVALQDLHLVIVLIVDVADRARLVGLVDGLHALSPLLHCDPVELLVAELLVLFSALIGQLFKDLGQRRVPIRRC
jgi:hypothetical protein